MCGHCKGLGYSLIDMQFLPAVKVPCEACGGLRLNPLALSVYYKEKNLGQVLDLTIDEAYPFFENHPKIEKRLQMLIDTGLGYLKLGQDLASLSGGEAQRIRLAKELTKRSIGHTLYLLDEPTTGLSFCDIEKLLLIMHKLADKKHTLIIIEHNLDIIKNADYILDLGPDAGIYGGKIVASGTPEEIIKSRSQLAGFLRKSLGND